MYIPFEEMPQSAKIWVYVSNKIFDKPILENITIELHQFCQKWTKHGEPLRTSFTIKYNQFIVLAVDESFQELSGCAINKSIKFIKSLEETHQIELLNRLNTAWVFENKINVLPLTIFKQYATQKIVQPETIVFNNLVTTLGELQNQWQVPAQQSWHSRFLN